MRKFVPKPGKPTQCTETQVVDVLEFEMLYSKHTHIQLEGGIKKTGHPVQKHMLNQQQRDAAVTSCATRDVTANTACMSQLLKLFARDDNARQLVFAENNKRQAVKAQAAEFTRHWIVCSSESADT